MELTGKALKEVKGIIQERIDSGDVGFIFKVIEIVYANQSSEEQAGGYTRHQNGKGFTGFDANFMTSIHGQLKQGRTLSPKQLTIVIKIMRKYWAQAIYALSEHEITAIRRKFKLDKLMGEITNDNLQTTETQTLN